MSTRSETNNAQVQKNTENNLGDGKDRKKGKNECIPDDVHIFYRRENAKQSGISRIVTVAYRVLDEDTIEYGACVYKKNKKMDKVAKTEVQQIRYRLYDDIIRDLHHDIIRDRKRGIDDGNDGNDDDGSTFEHDVMNKIRIQYTESCWNRNDHRNTALKRLRIRPVIIKRSSSSEESFEDQSYPNLESHIRKTMFVLGCCN
jgi:hypothetical protein